MKVAVERCPESGDPLASQSTISRLENAPRKTEAARLTAALVDQFCTSVRPGRREILDIDGKVLHRPWRSAAGVLGMPITTSAAFRPCTSITSRAAHRWWPSASRQDAQGYRGEDGDVHVTRRIRKHWPKTKLVWRGDSHDGRDEAMEWAENNGVDYIFGLAGNSVLEAFVAETADHLRLRHLLVKQDKLRCHVSFKYQANSWSQPRRVVARLEVSLQPDPEQEGLRQEVDVRYVVTSLAGSAQHIYERVYCERGQMENLIKLHKAQLALGPHLLSQRHRQSGSPCAAHGCVLAGACGALGHP